MTHLGISNEDKHSIYTLVASVLHLGNITFEENTDDTKGIYKSKINNVHSNEL